MTHKQHKPKRLRVSTLKTEQDCVREMCRLYKMARHDELSTPDLTRYIQAITQVHNALTIGRYGAEIEDLRAVLDRAKTENASNVVRLRRVQQ